MNLKLKYKLYKIKGSFFKLKIQIFISSKVQICKTLSDVIQLIIFIYEERSLQFIS